MAKRQRAAENSRASATSGRTVDASAGGKPPMAWGYLIHLGFNMWEDREAPEIMERMPSRVARPYLRCDQELWDDVARRFAEIGGNMFVIDLGEGVRYESHPELGCKKAWTPTKLKKELAKLRKLGIEPIPKLNFSTAHDTWLGPYARQVSTPIYYEVCKNLIEEVCELFDRPRLFHLGMDEETIGHQRYYAHAMVRQHELWWHDLHFLVNEVEKHNVRSWVWSDYGWNHPEMFWKHMPRSVMQSNWYYGNKFDTSINYVKMYHELNARGYDQIPTGSNHNFVENMPMTVEYLQSIIDPALLHGYLQTPWRLTMPEFKDRHLQAIDATKQAMDVASKKA